MPGKEKWLYGVVVGKYGGLVWGRQKTYLHEQGEAKMKSMVYYPGFEVQNEKWLKFALLYFEELRPIIPDMLISENR